MPDQGLLAPADVRRRRRFALHLLGYALANVVLLVTWLVVALATERWFPWPLVVTAAWGLVLELHRRAAYAPRPARR
ncbi:2TM domain-containing protein [Blastococcus sp. TF02A-30]|uniref:2TM domain-containing protein n=1 Tax=Blastococcus sp. TF02A-30 TaxID=2250580 RepID=UPI000DE9DE3E|nr:2TM domain-containing protein [Blastococcus sp. TF02A-30]RBY87732.1 hypothetical protein DQ241_10665 [Blastococcus sp. TF02A-30]